MSTTRRQPWLHELVICVDGNATALSGTDGDVVAGSVCGLYVDDRRVLSALAVRLGGEPVEPVTSAASGSRAVFLGSARGLGNPGPDPTVELHRARTLGHSGLTETLTVVSRASEPVEAVLEVEVASDGQPVSSVKGGDLVGAVLVPAVGDDGTVVFRDGRHETTLGLEAGDRVVEVAPTGRGARFRVTVRVDPGGRDEVALRVRTHRVASTPLDADPGSDAVAWERISVTAQDQRLTHVVQQGLDDLQHLLLRDPDGPEDVFAAAGTPWYLTLFGRDSLWAARMMLPFGTELAGGTLRALARRQGRAHDPASGEAPGKIPHELRRSAYEQEDSGLSLPPVYYGTIDATALWVTLLGEAWEWGLPEEQVRELAPALRAATRWLRTDGRGEDGFLRYVDETGRGLANQGWKDSGDSIRWRDGSLADAPIALVEAQAYAVEALHHAARLHDALGLPGGEALAKDADALRQRIQDRFWVRTDAGEHLAIALDAAGRPVDGLASNMGHVLGTGVLTAEQSAQVAATLVSDELLDGFGVRTLGSGNGGFNPIGYHTGSIWTHDTAIAAFGLWREGHLEEAATVARTLLASGEAFDYRWPELYSGEPLMGRPYPYPAACRPQAWSAASAGVLLLVALGVRPDRASGALVAPAAVAPVCGPLAVEGLRVGDRTLRAAVDAQGVVTVG